MKEEIKKSFNEVDEQIKKLNMKSIENEKEIYNQSDKLKKQIADNFSTVVS